MFLAKVWKTANGKKYEAWVLKKGVWDKIEKRYRQVYLAYVGTTTKITHEKAAEICTKLGVSLSELKRVRRLKIAEGEPVPSQIQASVASLHSQETGVTFSLSSSDPAVIIEPAVQAAFLEEESAYPLEIPVVMPRAELQLEAVLAESSASPVDAISSPSSVLDAERRLEPEFQEQLLILPPTSPASVLIAELQSEPHVGLSQTEAMLSEPVTIPSAVIELTPEAALPTSEPVMASSLQTDPESTQVSFMEIAAVPEPVTIQDQLTELEPEPEPEELEIVTQISLLAPEPHLSSSVGVAQPPPPALSLAEAAELVRKLREQFGLSRTPKGYEELAMRVGVLRVNARELRRAEDKENTLVPDQAGWLEKMLHSAPRRRAN